MMKQKIELEYTINSSPKILYNRISTPAGLAEWFADDININGDIFTFIWDESEQSAELLKIKENKSVRFKWIDDEDEESYFEFQIQQHELTGDVALVIVDFSDDDEADETAELWDSSIAKLKHALGI